MGNTTFLFRETDWKEAMILLKRGQINVILTEQNGKPEYHFDPRNPDAQLSYIKLSGVLNGESGKYAAGQWRNQTVDAGRHPIHRFPGSRIDSDERDDVVHVGH